MDNFTVSSPKICDCGGDLTKQWYIYFRGKNNLTGESKQFRFKLGINRFSKKKEWRLRKRLCAMLLICLKRMVGIHSNKFAKTNKRRFVFS